ncbi:MAG: hypothetical protein LWX02_00125 [Deltaproteobacteria bacterium]|jgi:hypothetical protein|nr:hypothetical protein [Deltaproteobacteria bacterium]MDL1986587.1 hypothetical protein [Deltaproteobacteria bacterium]
MEDSQLDTKARTATPNHVTEQEALNSKGDLKPRLDKIRNWFSMVVLPLMVIIILFAQLKVMQNQADISEKQADISERQYLSSVEPIVSIGEQAESFLSGSSGVFTIKLKNIGIMDVYDVEIYVNYLICPCEKMKTGKYLRCDVDNPTFPYLSTLPSKQFQELKVGEEIPYKIDTRKAIVDDKYPCFMRLRLDYKRKVDSRNFSKIFAFTLHGDSAINMEHDGDSTIRHKKSEKIASIKDFLLNKL